MRKFFVTYFVSLLWLQGFHNKTGHLAELIKKLQRLVDDLRNSLVIANPLVQQAVDHAKALKELADKLKKLLQDTQKFADAALRAAKVYANIVDAIYEALEAAKVANMTTFDAQNKVFFFFSFQATY